MKVHQDLEHLPHFKNAVITIGSFDGVHLGHQKIIERVNQLARANDGESILITFHPHPRLVVYPKDQSLQLLNTIDEKVSTLEKSGLDHLVIVPFTVEFSQMTADEYIVDFLVKKLKPKFIVIGYDHKFGLNRQGDIDYLKFHQEQFAFQVEEIAKQEIEENSISSTKIRQAIQAGQVQRANQLLGHKYLLTGEVIKGEQIGKTLGFPTANLQVADQYKLIPPNGIYAVEVLHKNKRYGGMLYIGDRPSIEHLTNQTIEVNIFDFDQQIYGDQIQLELIDFIRGDMAFSNLEALSAQLAKDKVSSLEILGSKQARSVDLQLAVVILNYNGRDYLETFLPSVLASTYEHFEIIIADNGSTDDSLAWLEQQYPAIKVLDLQENSGFAEGYNRALKQVEADVYVLLNSDVEVTPGWLEPIVDLMAADTSIAACQPKIRAQKQKDYFEYAGASGGWMDALGYPFCRGRIFDVTEKDEGQYDSVEEIFWATGAAMFIRSDIFHGLGGFDPDYFAHAEEIDLCWRIKLAGYKIMVQPQSVVYHVGGGTLNYLSPRKTYLNFRNTLFTIHKNESRAKLLWLLPLRLVLDGVAAGLFLMQSRYDHISAIVKAHWSFFGSISSARKKKKTYQQRINTIRIGPSRVKIGQYKGSIVWQYFLRRKKFFNRVIKNRS